MTTANDTGTFWFKPEHQPNEEVAVEFRLKPLDAKSIQSLTASIIKNGAPIAADFEAILLQNVVDWRGIGGICTLERRRKILDSEPPGNWNPWLRELAAKLYVKDRSSEPIAVPANCGCCARCRAELPDHWLSDFWRYCPHRETLSRRRREDKSWTVDHGVKPRKAAKYLAASVERMRAWAQAQGLELADLDKLLTQFRLDHPEG